MKSLKIALLALLLMCASNTQGCHLSNMVLDSLTSTAGGDYKICFTLNIGSGINGAVLGADNWTGTIAFGLFGTSPITVSSFSPASITSDSTACTNTGTNVGAAFGAQVAIGYISPGCFLSCVSSTALCGGVSVESFSFCFETDVLPDSIVAFGVEGTGNPVAGCYGNSDMTIVLNIVLSSDKPELALDQFPDSNHIKWTNSSSYENVDEVLLLKSLDGHNWQIDSTLKDDFGINGHDDRVLYEECYYKLMIKNSDGIWISSDQYSVDRPELGKMNSLLIRPNPSSSIITLSFNSTLENPVFYVIDYSGKYLKLEDPISNYRGRVSYSIQNLKPGIYTLMCPTNISLSGRRFVKL